MEMWRWAVLVLATGIASTTLAFGCDSAETTNPPSDNSNASSTSSSGASTSTSDASGSSPRSDGGCVIEPFDNPNTGASGGPSGCAIDTDCTIRFVGDFCCPMDPQAMTGSAAMFFDEGRNGYKTECRERCEPVRCAAPPDAGAVCVNAKCQLR